MIFSICLYMFYHGTIFNILSENLIAQIYYSWIFHCTFCYPNKANACMIMLVLLLSLDYPIVSSFCCSVKVTGIFVNNFSTKPLFTCHKFHWHTIFFLHYSAPAQLWERANHSLTKPGVYSYYNLPSDYRMELRYDKLVRKYCLLYTAKE